MGRPRYSFKPLDVGAVRDLTRHMLPHIGARAEFAIIDELTPPRSEDETHHLARLGRALASGQELAYYGTLTRNDVTAFVSAYVDNANISQRGRRADHDDNHSAYRATIKPAATAAAFEALEGRDLSGDQSGFYMRPTDPAAVLALLGRALPNIGPTAENLVLVALAGRPRRPDTDAQYVDRIRVAMGAARANTPKRSVTANGVTEFVSGLVAMTDIAYVRGVDGADQPESTEAHRAALGRDATQAALTEMKLPALLPRADSAPAVGSIAAF